MVDLEYHRLDEAVLHLDDTMVDLKSSSTGLELPEAYNSLLAEEEATALSIWAVACMCGALRLEHMLTFFTAALLEKQIVVVCSNLGILSASVLSDSPLIRPCRWQSLLMPVLPNDLLEFLDAPVPYIDGKKMGKSLGNTFEPNDLVHKFGTDAVRYFFLGEVEFGTDAVSNIWKSS